jgi:hypothetical protein
MIIDYTSLISHVSVSPLSSLITAGKFVSIDSDGRACIGVTGSRPFGLATEDHVPGKRIPVIVSGDSFELNVSFISGQSVWSNVNGDLQSSSSSPGGTWRKVGVATAVNRFKLSNLLEDASVY